MDPMDFKIEDKMRDTILYLEKGNWSAAIVASTLVHVKLDVNDDGGCNPTAREWNAIIYSFVDGPPYDEAIKSITAFMEKYASENS